MNKLITWKDIVFAIVIIVVLSFGASLAIWQDRAKATVATESVECQNCVALKEVIEISANNVDAALKAVEESSVWLDSLVEEPNEPPVYGNGNPPAEYQEYFGNDNGARLDFVQNEAISQLSARIGRLEGGDPND